MQGPCSVCGLFPRALRAWSSLRRHLLAQQRVDRLIDRLPAHALVADDALAVEDVERRVALHAPPPADGPPRRAAVPPRREVQLLRGDDLLHRLAVLVAVHAEYHERLAGVALQHLALLRVHLLAEAAPVRPEAQQDDLAA